VRRYAVAGWLTIAALALALLGKSVWGTGATFSFLLGAVMLSSWVGGRGPGIVSTALGTLAADYFLITPLYTVSLDVSRIIQLSAFVAISILISSLNDARRRAVDALADERTRLEERVVERTAELAAANDSLRAEIERRSQSERNFRGLIDAAPDAIVVIDTAGTILKVNDEAERMFGYSGDALLGHDVEMIIPDRFKAAHRAKRAGYGETAATRTIGGELAGRRADGSEFPVEIRVSPLDTQGRRSVVGIVRDVTERHRAQQLQQRLVHDLGERVKEVTALHTTGRLLNEPGTPAELLGRIATLLPSAWQYSEVAGARIAAGGVDVRTALFDPDGWVQRAEFPTADGATGAIEVSYREARPAAAEGPFLAEERYLIDSLAGMLRSYFLRLRAEEDRVTLARAEAQQLQAQEANAAKDQFLATLSHELRSPLNVMIGWIQMLRSGQVSADAAARGFDVLERSVRLQAKLIEDLLDVSRIVAGKLRIEKRRVDLATIASAAVDAALPAARAKQVSLTAAIAPGLLLDADPQRLQQVVSNLLTNALKFTPEQGSIDVRVERHGGRAQIVVRDTGIGMAPELLPRVFDRFQQGDSSTTRTHTGLGLGLAIVRYLVEQHGGTIAAASAGRGHGSTFTVMLPLLIEEQAGADQPGRELPNRSLLSGVRVLVVDDEPDARTTLAAIVEQYGAEPTVAGSARDAFDAVSRARPDVLLSDVAMPDEDGYSLIRRIRATIDGEALPAAALSGYGDGDTKTHALDAGFQTYLAKPVDPALLATTLATLVHRSGEHPTPR
jgi:PAS domain S-box-containing protein